MAKKKLRKRNVLFGPFGRIEMALNKFHLVVLIVAVLAFIAKEFIFDVFIFGPSKPGLSPIIVLRNLTIFRNGKLLFSGTAF